jgi:predicted nucleic acid-binding protein
MRFWDTSALVPLLLHEPETERCRRLIADDPELAVWWCTFIECVSAIERRRRERTASQSMAAEAYRQLHELAADWAIVGPSEILAQAATRALRVHTLRAADAMQLAAAMVCAEGIPGSVPVVCLDQRLRDAAILEGFPVAPEKLH